MLFRVVVCLVFCVLLCSGQTSRPRRVSPRGSSLTSQRRTRNPVPSLQPNTTSGRPFNPSSPNQGQSLARVQRAPANSLQPLYDFLVKNGLNRLCKMLKQSDIENILLSVGSCTIFAPADDIFAFLPGDLWQSFRKDSSKKREFLMSHVVPGTVSSADVTNDMLVNAAEGSPIRFNVYDNGKVWTASGAQVLQPDLRQGQYTVHVIDQFLYPPATMTNVDYVRGHFDNFYRMLAVADPNNFLAAEGIFTIFVPGDEAFRALPEFLYEAIFSNNTLLQSVLLNHIVPSTYYRVGLPLGGNLKSLDDNLLRFKTRRGLVLVNGIPILQPDISVTNGVIHVINRVILPPNVFEDCNCIPTTPAYRRSTTFLPTTKPSTEQTLIFDDVQTTPRSRKRSTASPTEATTEFEQPTTAKDVTTEILQTDSTTRSRRPSFAPLTLPPFESSRLNGNQDAPRKSKTTPLPTSTEAPDNECPDGEECPAECPDGKDCLEEELPQTDYPEPQQSETECPYGDNCLQETPASLDPKVTTPCSDGVDCDDNPLTNDSPKPQYSPVECTDGEPCPDNSQPTNENTTSPSESDCPVGNDCSETPEDVSQPEKEPIFPACPEGQFCPKFPEPNDVPNPDKSKESDCPDGENCPENQGTPLKDVSPESLCPVGNFCPDKTPPVKIDCPEGQECLTEVTEPYLCTGPSCAEPECQPGEDCTSADSPLIQSPGLSPQAVAPDLAEETECKGGLCISGETTKTTTQYPDGDDNPNLIPSQRRKPSRKPPGFIRIPYGPLSPKTSPKPILSSTVPDDGNNLVTSADVSIFPPASTNKPPILESRPQYGSENNQEEQPSSPVTEFSATPYATTVETTVDPESSDSSVDKSTEITSELSPTVDDSNVTRMPRTTLANTIENRIDTTEQPSLPEDENSSPASQETSPSDESTDSSVTKLTPMAPASPTVPTTFETKGPFDFLDDIVVTASTPTVSEQPMSTESESTLSDISTSKKDSTTDPTNNPTKDKPTDNPVSAVSLNTNPSTEVTTPVKTQPQDEDTSSSTETVTKSESKQTSVEVTQNYDTTTKVSSTPDQTSELSDEPQETQQQTEKTKEPTNSEPELTQSTQSQTDIPSKQPPTTENDKTTSLPITTSKNEDTQTENQSKTPITEEEDTTSDVTTPKVPITITPLISEGSTGDKDIDTSTPMANDQPEITSQSKSTSINGQTTPSISEPPTTEKNSDVPTQGDSEMTTEQNAPSSEASTTLKPTLPSQQVTENTNSEDPSTAPTSLASSPEVLKTTEGVSESTQTTSESTTTSKPTVPDTSLPQTTTVPNSQPTSSVQDSSITTELEQQSTVPNEIASTLGSNLPETPKPCINKPGEPCIQRRRPTRPTSEPPTKGYPPKSEPEETTTPTSEKDEVNGSNLPQKPKPCINKPGEPCIKRRRPTKPTNHPPTEGYPQKSEPEETTPKNEKDEVMNDPPIDIQLPETTQPPSMPEKTTSKLTSLRPRPTVPIIPYVTVPAEKTTTPKTSEELPPTTEKPTMEQTTPTTQKPTRPTVPIIPYVTTSQDSSMNPEESTTKPEKTTKTTLASTSTAEPTEDTGFYTDYTPTLSPQPEYQEPIPQVPELRPETLDPTWNDQPPNSIEDVLNRPNLVIGKVPVTFHVVLKLFSNVGLTDILLRKGPYTLCVPTDAAFSLLPAGYLQQLQKNGELLRKILLHHVITSQLAVANLRNNFVIRTYQGLPVVVNVFDAGKVVLIGGSRVLGTARTRNGVLYVTNRFFSVLPEYNLLRGIRNNPELSQFYDYIINSPLKQVLRARGPFTLAAPTNEAFAQLRPEVLNMLATNQTALEMVLYNHLTTGAHWSAEITRDLVLPTPRGGTLWFHITSGGLEINDARVLRPDISCGNGVMHVLDKVLLSSQGIFDRQNDYANDPPAPASFVNLAEVAHGLGVDTFVKWFEMSGLLQKINDGGRYTVLAPHEDAIRSLPPTTFKSLQENPNMLQQVLKYHVLEGFFQPTQLANEDTFPTLLTGKRVRFNWYKNDTELTVSGAKLGLDRRRDNVVVQVINRVLYPPAGDIMATVSRSPLLQDLTRALVMTGMDKELSGSPRPYTLFAPTEEAFRNLPKSEYMTLFNSVQEMTRLLKRHLHEGTLFSSGVSNGMSLSSQSGQDLTITTKPQCIVVDGVNVLYSDITATNGVVHVLNHLL